MEIFIPIEVDSRLRGNDKKRCGDDNTLEDS